MSIEEDYSILKEEISLYRKRIQEVIISGTEEESLCKGFAVWFSELKFQPTFLFIGINPGAGFYREYGIKYRDTDLDPSDCFEYCEYGGKLAEDTIEVFSKLKLEEELLNSVKTNIHYIVTNNQKELIRLQGLLIDKFGINLYEKAEQWTKKIIEIIQPKCILCEGAYSAMRLAEYYGVNFDWQNNICRFMIKEDTFVIGYKRTYATIMNKNELQNQIGKVYKEIIDQKKTVSYEP